MTEIQTETSGKNYLYAVSYNEQHLAQIKQAAHSFYRARTFNDPHELLDLLHKKAPSALVVDGRLGGMSGAVKGCRTSALAPRLLRARLGRCRTSLRGGNCGRVTLGVFADVVYGDLTVCPWLMVGFLVAVWPLDDVRWVI